MPILQPKLAFRDGGGGHLGKWRRILAFALDELSV
jgi:hypothetical protein